MNEADFVFDNEGSLVEVPYVEPSFYGNLNVKSMIPRSHGIWMNDMNNDMLYRNYDMCYVYVVMCYAHKVMFDDACFSHGINFLIQKSHSLS